MKSRSWPWCFCVTQADVQENNYRRIHWTTVHTCFIRCRPDAKLYEPFVSWQHAVQTYCWQCVQLLKRLLWDAHMYDVSMCDKCHNTCSHLHSLCHKRHKATISSASIRMRSEFTTVQQNFSVVITGTYYNLARHNISTVNAWLDHGKEATNRSFFVDSLAMIVHGHAHCWVTNEEQKWR